jgi:hypothetical protein
LDLIWYADTGAGCFKRLGDQVALREKNLQVEKDLIDNPGAWFVSSHILKVVKLSNEEY